METRRKLGELASDLQLRSERKSTPGPLSMEIKLTPINVAGAGIRYSSSNNTGLFYAPPVLLFEYRRSDHVRRSPWLESEI